MFSKTEYGRINSDHFTWRRSGYTNLYALLKKGILPVHNIATIHFNTKNRNTITNSNTRYPSWNVRNQKITKWI